MTRCPHLPRKPVTKATPNSPDYCGLAAGRAPPPKAASNAESTASFDGSSGSDAGLALGAGFAAFFFAVALAFGSGAGAGSAGASTAGAGGLSGAGAVGCGSGAGAGAGGGTGAACLCCARFLAGVVPPDGALSSCTGAVGKGATTGASAIGAGASGGGPDGRLHTLPRGNSTPFRSSPPAAGCPEGAAGPATPP